MTNLDVSRGGNTYMMDYVVCPYCGYVDGDSWEFGDYDEEAECGDCGRTFAMEINVSRVFSTYPMDEEDEDEE